MSRLVLHYAPDNASLCVRLALDLTNTPYETRLVDRRSRAQKSDSYRALNPNGLIPVLETPDGPLFETAAILLWLSEHHDGLMPKDGPDRAQALIWLIWVSNTLHATLRRLFYPDHYIDAAAVDTLSETTLRRLREQLTILEAAAARTPAVFDQASGALHCYLCPMLRWSQLYPVAARQRPDLSEHPTLLGIARAFEAHPAVRAAAVAEGLGTTPFSAPSYPTPPEGAAL